jgi:hypothetical protein
VERLIMKVGGRSGRSKGSRIPQPARDGTLLMDCYFDVVGELGYIFSLKRTDQKQSEIK